MDTTEPSPQRATLPIPEITPPFPKRKAGPGRPSSYDQDTADDICDRLADGESLRAICRDEHMPEFRTVFRWLQVRDGFRRQYAEARDIGLEHMADELLAIADDSSNDWIEKNDPQNPGYLANGEHIARSRLRVDTRKWILSKLAPKRYGDKLQAEINGIMQADADLPATEIARRLAIALMGATPVSEE